VTAALLTLPYGLFMALTLVDDEVNDDEVYYCEEVWPHQDSRITFGVCTSILQFIIPFVIITFCYIKICTKLNDRAQAMPGAKSQKKEELEKERTRRTNRMLISMVIIFGCSWLPLNLHNLVEDFYDPIASWRYWQPIFLLAHAIAMSSTCYNPFLYAWLNENFKLEFKRVLHCFGKRQRRFQRAMNSEYSESIRNCTLKEYLAPDPFTTTTTGSTHANSVSSVSVANGSCNGERKPTSVKYTARSNSVKLHIGKLSESDCDLL